MRVGILTFHGQVNYGGILQAFALQKALEAMGHQVVVLDRWMQKRNQTLRGPWRWSRLPQLVCRMVRGVFGDAWGLLVWRYLRTIRFARRELKLSPYHFFQWKDVRGRELGIDCVVVGSDQVWNGEWQDPSVYLLKGAPGREVLRAVSYAASFGMRAIPDSRVEVYREGMERFAAISVREREGVALVKGLGREAQCVVDPTLLVEPEMWRTFASNMPAKSGRRRLVCCFLKEDVSAMVGALEAFAERVDGEVVVFVSEHLKRVPRGRGRVKFAVTAGPREFVEGFAGATWVCTDSFHALMFASIFEAQVAMLRPSNEDRAAMFARIEEACATFTVGRVIEGSLEAALERFARGETMAFVRK